MAEDLKSELATIVSLRKALAEGTFLINKGDPAILKRELRLLKLEIEHLEKQIAHVEGRDHA